MFDLFCTTRLLHLDNSQKWTYITYDVVKHIIVLYIVAQLHPL